MKVSAAARDGAIRGKALQVTSEQELRLVQFTFL